ncbi:unnamed protein product [Brassica rapa]|uniref:Uncharacterized protein n=1 Tax=Brassica campestris TaxID=3711 RepID=A0A8D9DMY8_BRACM|nr:unnamed protein product [Brassica rapa]
MHPFQKSRTARPRHIPADTWKVGTDADLTVIFCPETNVLSGTEFLRVTAIIFLQPRSQQTAYSPLRTMHKLCKDARITSVGLCVHNFPTEGDAATTF